jgi:hypothetical protein
MARSHVVLTRTEHPLTATNPGYILYASHIGFMLKQFDSLNGPVRERLPACCYK